MMWIYACFYIIFLGAEINKVVESKRKEWIYNGLYNKG
jgi:uncharacterized BrkB/YihY/UPF0761 family membrane protein